MSMEYLLEYCKGLCSEVDSHQLTYAFYIGGRRLVVLSPNETHDLALSGRNMHLGPSHYVYNAVATYNRWLDCQDES